MKVKNSFTCLTPTGSGFGLGSLASQPPGSLKTTTSPRCGCAPNHGVNLSTRTRSPIWIVCSIDPEGMTNACNRNVLSTSAISRATPTSSGTSLRSERLRFRLTLRASLRRSTRELPVSRGASSVPVYEAASGPSSGWSEPSPGTVGPGKSPRPAYDEPLAPSPARSYRAESYDVDPYDEAPFDEAPFDAPRLEAPPFDAPLFDALPFGTPPLDPPPFADGPPLPDLPPEAPGPGCAALWCP